MLCNKRRLLGCAFLKVQSGCAFIKLNRANIISCVTSSVIRHNVA
jgi:hypothetical protein